MPLHTYPIVGSSYRPPAAEILDCLAHGTKLILRPEPWNEHDKNAKAVFIKQGSLTGNVYARLDDGRLRKHQITIRNVAEMDEIQLGYIPAKVAATFTLEGDTLGTFTVSPSGAPQIKIEIGETL